MAFLGGENWAKDRFQQAPSTFPPKGRAHFDSLGRRGRLEQQMKNASQIS